MEAMKERPPYVTFETRAIEDREASISAGHYVPKDEHYAIITPAGSKDRIERLVKEWFLQLDQQVSEGRFPREWLQAYKAAYKDWTEGHEPAVNGTDVRNWPVASPAQTKQLLDVRVRTVEDLAVANEETIARLGMGGRALKQRALEWLESAKNIGGQSERIAALEAKVADLTAANETLQARNTELAQAAAAVVSKKL